MACTWPEEVLRVPRKCADVAVLRAAYRRCSMAGERVQRVACCC